MAVRSPSGCVLSIITRSGRAALGHKVGEDAPWRHAITRSLPMTATITAFERSPDGGKGLARDMRVRWALEEVGQTYDVRLVSFKAMKEPAHVALGRASCRERV